MCLLILFGGQQEITWGSACLRPMTYSVLGYVQKIVRTHSSLFSNRPISLVRNEKLYSLFGGVDVVCGLAAPLATKQAIRLSSVSLIKS